MILSGTLWAGLSTVEREHAAKLCVTRRLAKGRVLFGPGSIPAELYIVASRLVTLSYLAEDGEEAGRRGQSFC